MKRLIGNGLVSCSWRSLSPLLLRRTTTVPFYLRCNASQNTCLLTEKPDGMPQRISYTMAAKSKESFGEDLSDKEYSFSKGFLHFLGQVYQETHKQQLPPTQLQKIEAEAKSIVKQLADTSGSPSRAINVEFTAYMVAPYRILKASGQSVSQIRHLLEEALQHTMAWSSQLVRQHLDTAPDAFESLVRESKDKEENFYVEPDFQVQRARDLPDSYSLEVHSCWYMNALQKLDAREIGPSLCAFDRSWYNAIDPQRHGVMFTRPSTIAKGADRCRFNFDRVKKTVKE